MRGFMRTVLAVVIGIAVFHLGALTVVYYKWGRESAIRSGSILRQPVRGPMVEYPPGGFTSGFLAPDGLSLHSVLDNLSKAAVDKRVTGVLLRLGTPQTGYASLDEIREAIAKVRKAGKPVWAWADNVGLKDLYVAAACDSFFVHPGGYVALGGLYSERLYVSGTLAKLGIVPDVQRIESYKSAAEMVTRRDMSPQAREMLGWIQADIYPRVLDAVAAGRRVDRGAVEKALAQGLYMPGDLVATGLIDGVRQWDEMTGALPRPKGDDEPRFVAASRYDDVSDAKVGLKGKKKIAVVHAEGLIGGEKSGVDPFLGIVMGYRDVNRDLQKALDDRDVAGVILRIDSGGGDALTSEYIGRMVERVNAKKPVVVSMVDVAASGGYHIAYPARTLVAGGSTITGSIGSITGKMNARGLYEKLGITKDGLGTGPNGDFYSDYRSWTKSEEAKVRENHWASYDRWIADIARVRKLAVADVDSVGRGRVWTGRQALERKLVDRLGGLDEAVLAVKEAAGIDSTARVTLVHYPKPEGFWASLLGTNLGQAGGIVLERWMGERVEAFRSLQRSRLEVLEVPIP